MTRSLLCVSKSFPRDWPYPFGFCSTGLLPPSFSPCYCRTRGSQSSPLPRPRRNKIWGTSKCLSFEEEKWIGWKIGPKCKCPTALMNMSQLPRECCTKTRRQAWTVQKFWKMSSWIHFKEKLFVFKTRYESCCDERLQWENWHSEVMMWSCWKTRRRRMHTKANTLNKWVNKGGTMASQEVSFLLLRSVNGVGSCFEYWSLTSLQREAGLEAVCVHKLRG